MHTFEKSRGKVDTNIPIPSALADLFHFARNGISLNFFHTVYDSLLIAESDNDFGHAEEERLSPEFEEFSFVFQQVTIISDLCGGFEFYPADVVLFFFGFAVPYCCPN